jgi:hypothetical protein
MPETLEVVEMHGECGHSRKMSMYRTEDERFTYCYKCAKAVMFYRQAQQEGGE